jgi:hypothetical protein
MAQFDKALNTNLSDLLFSDLSDDLLSLKNKLNNLDRGIAAAENALYHILRLPNCLNYCYKIRDLYETIENKKKS